MSFRNHIFRLLAGLALLIAADGHADVQYSYDAAGRVTGVVDAAGNAARYEYDAAGNIKRIDRFASTAIAIFGFSPAQGPVGTQVTISGKGFSTITNQNSVRFNGVASSVISAASDRLVVTVPVSASSGTITVVAPSGTGSSLDPFVVPAAPNAPTITGFAPAYGGVGDQFSVSGTGFSAVIPDNQLTVGGAPAGIVASTSTSLSALVGASTQSGPLSLTAPGGSAVSQNRFTVLENSYRTADVGLLQQGSIGTAWTFNAADTNKVYVLTFAGQAGQRISISITNQTTSSALTRIYGPSGSFVGGPFSSVSGNTYSPSMTLPVAGEYQLVFDPAGIGNATIRVIADTVGTLIAGGDAATLTTTVPGQNAAFTFSGTAGQRVSAVITGTTFTNGSIFTILAPGGATVGSNLFVSSSGFMDTRSLPVTGTYILLADPSGAGIGSTTVRLHTVPADPTATLIAGGDPAALTTTTPGQNAVFTFSGIAGQRVSAVITGTTFTNGSIFTMLAPGGAAVGSPLYLSSSGFMDTRTLPATGTYTLLADPSGAGIGSTTVKLHTVPADAAAAITIGGPAATVVTTTPGQNGLATFPGTAGQMVTVHAAGNTLGVVTLTLLHPDGTTALTSRSSVFSSFSLPAVTLPVTGTYTVQTDPSGAAFGAINISVTSP